MSGVLVGIEITTGRNSNGESIVAEVLLPERRFLYLFCCG